MNTIKVEHFLLRFIFCNFITCMFTVILKIIVEELLPIFRYSNNNISYLFMWLLVYIFGLFCSYKLLPKDSGEVE